MLVKLERPAVRTKWGVSRLYLFSQDLVTQFTCAARQDGIILIKERTFRRLSMRIEVGKADWCKIKVTGRCELPKRSDFVQR